jgi:hypothetical protein
MMTAESDKFEIPFLTNWILVTSGAFILSLPVVIIVPQLVPPIPWTDNLGGIPIIGAFVGCAQWLMLRKRIALSGLWVLACAIGLGLPPIANYIASEAGLLPHFPGGISGKIYGWTSLGIIGGLLSGLLQMPLLKPHFAKAGWWIAASSAGWGLCLLAASTVDPLVTLANSSAAESSNLVVGGVTGLTLFVGGLLIPIPLGVVTGVGLLWIASLDARRI